MTTYASTFIPGMGEVVATALERSLQDVGLDILLDGLVVYRSSSAVADVQALRFCNNSFVCLMSFDGLGRNPISQICQTVLADGQLLRRVAPHLPRKSLTFRFVASQENRFVPIPQRTRRALVRLLAAERRLKPHASNPDIEFWLLSRREGFGFIGLRLTRHTAYEKTLARGELRPELCHLLCLLSEPSADDVVLDPFCGSGAIPLERARSFPYRAMLAGDIDAKHVKSLRAKVRQLRWIQRKRRQTITIGRWDAQDLQSFAPETVDKIITDPPWGFYQSQLTDLERFLRNMLQEFYRVLRRNGLLVILVGNPRLFEDCLRDFTGRMTVLQRYDILVSGKKASVFKVVKST
ncbi:MAG: methyltransferase domain-containing protein [Chloroflexota bacterium]|nr:methyltransferase domain-containing protein [Chloroflexota bacterium]